MPPFPSPLPTLPNIQPKKDEEHQAVVVVEMDMAAFLAIEDDAPLDKKLFITSIQSSNSPGVAESLLRTELLRYGQLD